MALWKSGRFGASSFIFLAAISYLAGGCAPQHVVTGEPLVFKLNPVTGEIVDRDIMTQVGDSPLGTIPHKDEIITIVANNIFLKYMNALAAHHVLVYAEVHDDGTDDPNTAVAKVLFNQTGQSSGVNLGLADRILYGPTAYKGYPIRIRLFIVELAKEQKETVSRILDAAGTIASTAQPAAAPAVGIIVQAAKMINALTEDDFELRFDLTLFPVDQIGKADVADDVLRPLGEPMNRKEKQVSLVSTLRTGSYIILKRELASRLGKREKECGAASAMSFDFAQQGFLENYSTVNGKSVRTQELLRYEGGYLRRIIRAVSGEGVDQDGGATVVPMCGPNAGVPTYLAPGIRQLFDDQTYVAISVLPGLPLGLSQEQLQAGSKRDAAQIAKLLDNPDQLSLSEKIGPQIDALASSVKSVLEVRSIGQAAARRVGRDPGFRTSTDYPAFWAQQIQSLDGLKELEAANAKAKNAGILSTLADIVINLPTLQPDKDSMRVLSGYTSESFETVEVKDKEGNAMTQPSDNGTGSTPVIRKGVFKIKADLLTDLMAADRKAASASAPAPAAATTQETDDADPDAPPPATNPATRPASRPVR